MEERIYLRREYSPIDNFMLLLESENILIFQNFSACDY